MHRVKHTIRWPTERHRMLVEAIVAVCRGDGVGVVLKGSIAGGTAGAYSDCDITITGYGTEHTIDAVCSCLETPLMMNGSENPPGLLIVAYRQGLALDRGYEESHPTAELAGTMELAAPVPCARVDTRRSLSRQIARAGKTDRYSKYRKLIHKGLLKYLNGHRAAARSFVREILEYADIAASRVPSPEDAAGFRNDSRGTVELPELFWNLIGMLIDPDDVMIPELRWLLTRASDG